MNNHNGHFKHGNPGKPKGAVNKRTKELRERVSIFLHAKMEDVFDIYEQLEPREKVKFFTDLLPYGLAKLPTNSILERDNEDGEEVVIIIT